MWPILFCSVFSLALILNKSFQFMAVLRHINASTERLLDRSPPCLDPIIQAIRDGLDEKQVSLIGTQQIRNLEKGLGILSLISVVAPLLGFTGTVTGMIRAFMVIAGTSAGRVEPAMVAGGIYEALITTAAGLFVAIPTHVALHFLEERLDEITFHMQAVGLVFWERRKNGI